MADSRASKSDDDRLDREDADRVRPQMMVERAADLVGRRGARQIDMRDLRQRVHAGIGAPGAEHGDGSRRKSGATAVSSASWIDSPFGWRCQPTKPAPQYSIVSL